LKVSPSAHFPQTIYKLHELHGIPTSSHQCNNSSSQIAMENLTTPENQVTQSPTTPNQDNLQAAGLLAVATRTDLGRGTSIGAIRNLNNLPAGQNPGITILSGAKHTDLSNAVISFVAGNQYCVLNPDAAASTCQDQN